jgi:hypothetical protein
MYTNHTPILLTTLLCAKPHVAAFIEGHFSRQLTDGLVTKLPKNEAAIYDAIGHHSTIHFNQRLTEPPAGMVTFKAALPKPYDKHFLSQQTAADFGKSLEEYFWREFKEHLLIQINTLNQYKDHVIRQFMHQYGITESMYPVDHFRRQCSRMKIRGLRDPIPVIRERIHRSIPDHICMQMYRIYSNRKISAKRIGDHYGFHRRAVERIIFKIKIVNLSKSDA